MNSNRANKTHANSSQEQWDIDRYLLSDPTLDRDAFEQRMLDDLSLAEQVAVSVADLQAISSVACSAASIAIAAPRTSSSRFSPTTNRWALLASAASLLIAVSTWQVRSVSSDSQLSLIADNWVTFENLTDAASLELIATEHQLSENLPGENQSGEYQTDAESAEQSDWLVEAAREFYLANNDGAAG